MNGGGFECGGIQAESFSEQIAPHFERMEAKAAEDDDDDDAPVGIPVSQSVARFPLPPRGLLVSCAKSRSPRAAASGRQSRYAVAEPQDGAASEPLAAEMDLNDSFQPTVWPEELLAQK